MEWKTKVTKDNVSTYNPLNYSEEQMQYSKITDQSQSVLDERSRTLEEELGMMGLGEINGQLKDPVPFKTRVEKTRTLSQTLSSSLSKTWKIFGNSKEMDTVIKNVNGLNSLLEGPVPRTVDGKIDADTLKKTHLKGYEAALNACQFYLDEKTPKYGWTKKRYNRVKAMKETLERELELLEVVISNIADQKYSAEELQNVQTTRDLLDQVRSVKVEGEAELQIEGNSTDVYRVRLNINGKEGWYYFKQNLKPVDNDLPGFVKRRLRQLGNSSSHIGDRKKEEARLFGKIDQTDYDLGTQFLTSMQTSINSVSDSIKDTRTLNKRLLTFLGHDFDRMFKELDEYNSRADQSERERVNLTAQLANAKTIANNDAAVQAYTNQLQNHKVLPRMNEYEWLVKLSKDKTNPLGITVSKDRALFNILRQMSETEDGLAKTAGGNNRIRRFFTRTLGKEIEAFGQQKERSNVSEKEVMAKNNTATYRVANLFGFNDVVTSSESAVVDIKLAGSENSDHITGTISVEAPGLEMLRLVEIAEKKGRKIHYSPNAIRQLVRLQMFDTTCMQTDRHWRNFKCMTKPDLREWDESKPLDDDIVIESIGSYDHDMSFGNISLKDAFKDKNNPDGPSIKNGMLPPILRKIKSVGAESSYYRNRIMGDIDLSVFDKMQMPLPQKGSGYAETHAKNSANGNYFFRSITASELGVDYKTLPKKVIKDDDFGGSQTFYEYKNMLLMKDPYSKDKLNICDDSGKKIGYNILDKLSHTERGLGLDYMSSSFYKTQEMLQNSKMVIGGTPVPKELIETISDCCTEISGLIKIETGEFQSSDAKRLSALSRQQQIDVLASAMKLHNALSQIDVSENKYEKENISHGTGYIEFRLRAVIFYLKQELDCMEPAEKDALLSEVKSRVAKDSMKEKKKDEEKAQDKDANPEYMEVPTMLHMDEKAYLDICDMRDRFDTDVRYALQDLGWDEEKINAYKLRINEQLEQIEKCRIIAEKVLAKKYPKEDDPLRHFFLKEEDYQHITDIRDIAWDPGMSYFATEDENFLMSDETYTSFLTEDEKKAKLENTNKHRKIERLHGLKQDIKTYNTMINGVVVKEKKKDDAA